MTIRVLSFDFDGCLCHEDFEEGKVVSSNLAFLTAIKAENPKYSRTILFSGSNRQSYAIDSEHHIRGWKKVGSSFPALKEIAEFLEVEHNLFLLSDLLGNTKLVDGTSYQNALLHLEQPEQNITHETCPLDDTKVLILFTQIQKVAIAVQEEFEKKRQSGIDVLEPEPIEFFFYDDRMDILEKLNLFFTKHPELLPKNVTVNLNQYCKKENELKSELVYVIKGDGVVDAHYEKTVTNMVRIHPPSSDNMLRVADFVNVKQLKECPGVMSPSEKKPIFELNLSPTMFARRTGTTPASTPVSTPRTDTKSFNLS